MLFGVFLTPIIAETLGFKADGTLDKQVIKELYIESEFDKIVNILEKYRREVKNPSDEDKAFTYKYLSVVYASNPNQREKAEAYMYRLLQIIPTVELFDLYVSMNVEVIFKQVKARFEEEQQYMQAHDEVGRPIDPTKELSKQDPESPNQEKQKKSYAWLKWTAGGLATAGLITGYLIFANESEQKVTSRTTKLVAE